MFLKCIQMVLLGKLHVLCCLLANARHIALLSHLRAQTELQMGKCCHSAPSLISSGPSNTVAVTSHINSVWARGTLYLNAAIFSSVFIWFGLGLDLQPTWCRASSVPFQRQNRAFPSYLRAVCELYSEPSGLRVQTVSVP